MHLIHIFFIMLVPVVALIVSPVFAGNNESIKTMANIMMHLNHFPSDSEKRQLMNIRNSADSENVKIIANAMINLQHSAQSADKPLLKQVMNDDKASQNLKTLASIIYNLNHKPTSEDKQQLSTMINFADNHN